MTTIKLKRVYLPAASSDGCRVLVDRVWPRGMTKTRAKVDFWLREIAPSNGLRKWFGHVPERWPEFKKRYLKELGTNRAATSALMDIVGAHRRVTLVFGARDEERNQAVVLALYLKRRMK
ncbi:MAG TPA: DUF488 family protein [Gammaproteobacteria bacterium]|nr:DUF488 family protein [Gammaproteobacteria bacterium]